LEDNSSKSAVARACSFLSSSATRDWMWSSSVLARVESDYSYSLVLHTNSSCRSNQYTSGLFCNESTRSGENLTGVSLFPISHCANHNLQLDIIYLVHTCDVGAVAGFEDPEPISSKGGLSIGIYRRLGNLR
jgi:hypothetical protein